MKTTIASDRWHVSRFGFFVPIVFILIVGAILVARWIGSLRPLPPLASILFSEQNGLLCETSCLLGIHPDQPDMFASMKAHPLLQRLEFLATGSDLTKTVRYSSDRIDVEANERGKWIKVLIADSLNPASMLPTPIELQGKIYLGDLIDVVGAPDFVDGVFRSGSQSEFHLLFFRGPYVYEAILFCSEDKLDTWADLYDLGMGMDAGINKKSLTPFRGYASIAYYQAP